LHRLPIVHVASREPAEEIAGGVVRDAVAEVVVLGAGVMGTGIAALNSAYGVAVTLIDTDGTKLALARSEVAAHLKLARIMGAVPHDRPQETLTVTRSLDDASGASLVIDAVTEVREVKAEVMNKISAIVRPGTPLVSNTSSIPIGELAELLPRPEDVIGTHFMNPPCLIPTVEVIIGARTAPATVSALEALLATLDRKAIKVGDSPGFVTSRVLHPMINDAIGIVERQVASPAKVDALFVDCLGHRTGPLRTADLIGLDNLADSLEVLYERTGDAGCRPNPLLLEMVRRGELGRKSGRGFYDYGSTSR
jgi:methoxymalonate biosynthesis protein